MIWKRLVSAFFGPAPLPSEYIDRFLRGDINDDEFASNIGDGWVGSDLKDWTWLDQVHEIEKRYNPDFPSSSANAWTDDRALFELRELMDQFRIAGK